MFVFLYEIKQSQWKKQENITSFFEKKKVEYTIKRYIPCETPWMLQKEN